MTADRDDCPAPRRPLLTKQQALDLLLAAARPPAEVETVPTTQAALGRVLAEPLACPMPMPPWDNSAMDGYAVRHADLADAATAGAARLGLRVAQRIPAGTAGGPLEPGTAARIFTGAPVPAGADTVVIQERCRRDGDLVEVPTDESRGANVRLAGEDLAMGAEVIATGTRLEAQHIGLAASVGAAELRVYRRLRVALFGSGDELITPGGPLGPGQVYDCNRYTLGALLAGLGCTVIDMGTVPDTLEATMDVLAAAAGQADLILGSGGVSVGEEDHVKPAIERLGTLDLWNVAIRPGKPLAFGRVAGTPFLGSPGNPVSLFVTALIFARPLILRMQGVAGDLEPPGFPVPAGFARARPDPRREFLRARLVRGEHGRTEVIVHPSRSAAALTSAAWADGLVEVPEGQAIARGDLLCYLPFRGLLC
jgi:molybdopterin molybdotransferase